MKGTLGTPRGIPRMGYPLAGIPRTIPRPRITGGSPLRIGSPPLPRAGGGMNTSLGSYCNMKVILGNAFLQNTIVVGVIPRQNKLPELVR